MSFIGETGRLFIHRYRAAARTGWISRACARQAFALRRERRPPLPRDRRAQREKDL
jgi:hypothetical protein